MSILAESPDMSLNDSFTASIVDGNTPSPSLRSEAPDPLDLIGDLNHANSLHISTVQKFAAATNPVGFLVARAKSDLWDEWKPTKEVELRMACGKRLTRKPG